jgi:autophagy-related protein 2
MMKDIYYVIHRELNDLKVTLIEIPKYEYNNNGVYSCIQQVVKGIPLVIIKPVLGTTEGIGRMLLTIRNILDEKTKTDMDRKYK